MPFPLFDILDKRRYRMYYIGGYGSWFRQFLEESGASGFVESFDEGTSERIVASHVVGKIPNSDSVNPATCALVPSLPKDYLEFLGTFDWALVVLRECYWLPAIAKIVEHNREIRAGYKDMSDSDGFNIFRFARFWDETLQSFAFRKRRDGSGWEVMWLNERDYMNPDEVYLGEDYDGWVTDRSFTDWLKRMVKTDGLPICPDDEEDPDPRVVRIP